ncbi:hypothetical protein BDR04DRAFT_1129180 [Suillus decipiens]|nr:hypothetical protein BDR04DRAFT_1129180 [Suillus decipiens]
MAPLSTLQFPLLPSGPPVGYGWEERDMSVSSTTAFNAGIDRQDMFLGRRCCVFCGVDDTAVSSLPKDESRDGLLMRISHHVLFNAYDFFVRFFPNILNFVLVNYSGRPSLQLFHGKAIALDISDHHAPFPSLFVIHEVHVRRSRPFQTIALAMPDDILWQGWILSDGVFDDVSEIFKRDGAPNNSNKLSVQPQLQFQLMTTSTGDTLSGPDTRTLALNEDVTSDILAATHAMPWSGTAEDNI